MRSHIFAVEFWCCQHLIELSPLIPCRLYLDLIRTICKICLAQKPVDITGMAFGGIDISVDYRDHILAQTLVDQVALFLEFLFIFWFIVALVITQQPVIHCIVLLHSVKANRRILSVKSVSGIL